jgi:hypothetical protein
MAGNALTESESIERLRAVLSEFVCDIDNPAVSSATVTVGLLPSPIQTGLTWARPT